MQILTIKQTSARESLLPSRHYSLSMTTVTAGCRLFYAITLQYESKPLTTTASSACLQLQGNHSVVKTTN